MIGIYLLGVCGVVGRVLCVVVCLYAMRFVVHLYGVIMAYNAHSLDDNPTRVLFALCGCSVSIHGIYPLYAAGSVMGHSGTYHRIDCTKLLGKMRQANPRLCRSQRDNKTPCRSCL